MLGTYVHIGMWEEKDNKAMKCNVQFEVNVSKEGIRLFEQKLQNSEEVTLQLNNFILDKIEFYIIDDEERASMFLRSKKRTKIIFTN